jgi:hypothetical protein
MSLISDALYLEATRTLEDEDAFHDDSSDPARQSISPEDQARRIAEWILAGRGAGRDTANTGFPGPNWLRQPPSYSDREWILAIADQYRRLNRRADVAAA